MDYDVVKMCAQEAYRNYGHDDSKFNSAMSGFYKEGSKNPSVAKIIMNDYINQNTAVASKMLNDAAALPLNDTFPLLYPEMVTSQKRIYSLAISTALKNISAQDLYKNAEMPDEKRDFDKKFEELYPGTKNKRERIIDSGRLSINDVTHKAGWFEKINYAKSVGEYKKDYPKTFYTRYALIMDGQIKEGEITSGVKNWFKRFSYKWLIKGKFGFKK